MSDFGAIFGGPIALRDDFYVAIPYRHVAELDLCTSALRRSAHVYSRKGA